MKSLINSYIEHKKYGRGLIISEEVGEITVKFAEEIGNKKFLFPDAFELFLKFEESSLQEESLLMVESKKQLLAEANEKKRLEQKKLEEERQLEELELKKKMKRTIKPKASSATKKIVKKAIIPDPLDE